MPASGVPPLVTWKVLALTLTGSIDLLKITPGATLTPTLVAPLYGTALVTTGSVVSTVVPVYSYQWWRWQAHWWCFAGRW